MASEHRGLLTQESTSPEATNVPPTYANVTAKDLVPKKDQAIVIDSIEGCTIDDYIDGLEKLVEVSNIRFISKISGARVCVYLTNSALVEKIVNKNVQVKSHILNIRPLIEKNKRVVISNASPSIPNEILIEALKCKGITIVSNMHHIRASASKPGRAHILSFRRQVYIKEEHESLLPETIQIVYDSTPHWIYLSTESTNCFICKQKGHIAKVCPNLSSQSSVLPQLSQVNNNILNHDVNTESTEVNDTVHIETINTDNTLPNIKSLKRPPPPSTSSENSSDFSNIQAQKDNSKILETKVMIKPINKKKKIIEKDNLDDQDNMLENDWSKINHIIQDNKDQLILDFKNFKTFIEKAYGQRNIRKIATEFTEDIEGLCKTIGFLHPYIENKRLKARCIRIKRKLAKQESDIETDHSQLSDS